MAAEAVSRLEYGCTLIRLSRTSRSVTSTNPHGCAFMAVGAAIPAFNNVSSVSVPMGVASKRRTLVRVRMFSITALVDVSVAGVAVTFVSPQDVQTIAVAAARKSKVFIIQYNFCKYKEILLPGGFYGGYFCNFVGILAICYERQ